MRAIARSILFSIDTYRDTLSASANAVTGIR